jgi:phenylacetate-CoA ligase
MLVFRNNGLDDIVVRESQEPPEFTASGKFHEVLALQSASSRT